MSQRVCVVVKYPARLPAIGVDIYVYRCESNTDSIIVNLGPYMQPLYAVTGY